MNNEKHMLTNTSTGKLASRVRSEPLSATFIRRHSGLREGGRLEWHSSPLLRLMVMAFILFAASGAGYAAATNYCVWKDNPDPRTPYTNWEMAATNIQLAVDLTLNGDTVEVTNGTYDTGGAVTPGYSLTNRVCITKAITLRSVNGPGDTTIVGAEAPGGGNGTGAVRCVYLTNAAFLIGFSLTNGHTMTNNDLYYDQSGAGVFLHKNAVVSNCIVRGNSANNRAGGVYLYRGGTVNNCAISWNTAGNRGAGAVLQGGALLNPEMNNCLISENTAVSRAGGIYLESDGVEVNNCTVVSNKAAAALGGGIYFQNASHMMSNCIVWGNIGGVSSNIYWSSTSTTNINYTCSGPAQVGTGNIDNDPQFVNSAAGNYRLSANSPCINRGANNNWMTNAVDLDGRTRIRYNIVDMGAYERINEGMIFKAW